jgi:hypothetical protein
MGQEGACLMDGGDVIRAAPIGTLLATKCHELGIADHYFPAAVRHLVARGQYNPDSIGALSDDDVNEILNQAAADRKKIPSLTQTSLGRALSKKCGDLAIRKNVQPTVRAHLLARGQWAVGSVQAMTAAVAIEMSKWPCEWCGRGFRLSKVIRRFCSEKCASLAWAGRHRVTHTEKHCALPLSEAPAHVFTPTRANQKYCSLEHGRRGEYLAHEEKNRAAAKKRFQENRAGVLLRLQEKRKTDPAWARRKNRQSKEWRDQHPEARMRYERTRKEKQRLLERKLNELTAKVAAADSGQLASPQPRRRGRRNAPREERTYFAVGQRVENKIPNGLKSDRHSIVAARRAVATGSRGILSYPLVAEYHREFRRTLGENSA